MNPVRNPAVLLGAWLLVVCSFSAQAQTPVALGAEVGGLLTVARAANLEYIGQRLEAEAAAERIEAAGALPDPKLRTELMDVTRGGQQNPNLLPSRVGSARYTFMQEVPWFGKRDLKHEIAEFEAQGAKERALMTWSDVAAKIKITYAQLFYLARNQRLTREILDLMGQLERLARTRYASGLSSQQEVIRVQLEQTSLRSELITLETERHHLHTRMNALLARPANAVLVEPAQLRPLPVSAQLDYGILAERARARNPLLAAEDARLRSAEKSRELAYKNRYPDVTFGIAPNQMQNAIMQWDLMVEMNIPLQQNTRRAQEREAETMLEAASTRRAAAANQILAELAEKLASLDAARQTELLISGSLLPQAELSFQSALAGYEHGKLGFATLLDAQRQIREAKQKLIWAQAEGQTRLAEVERILGEDL